MIVELDQKVTLSCGDRVVVRRKEDINHPARVHAECGVEGEIAAFAGDFIWVMHDSGTSAPYLRTELGFHRSDLLQATDAELDELCQRLS